ncbi:hypothetical protein [Nocardiopsis tropica]|uniref:Uncharacterized protein n=1 Tax=Nocardiopsis tropica TaxID=109330 RepID=A0ABU7KR86_9ACTN|nr:hypothetical protein [Nocardiopsis umidischolae]MEE2051813.1 hypothetical protein [Nocardiopsis umidischolae]
MTTYDGWGRVPAYLRTRTQLAELEYPRVPGEVAAWVKTFDWRGKPDTLDLFDWREAAPSPASAAQLEAAQRSTVRECGECGARPDGRLWELSGGVRVCRPCLLVARLRRVQRDLAEQRRGYAREVAELLGAEPGPVVVYPRRIRPPRPEGAARTPAVCAVELDTWTDGRRSRVVLRVGGARNPHVPDGAVPLAEGAPAAAALLAGRTPVVWNEEAADELAAIGEHLGRAGQDVPGRGRMWSARWTATVWRGDLDVSTRALGAVVDPGTPDRLALLLRRIAATADEPVPASTA